MAVHDAARGYESGARAYAEGRPSYPPVVVTWLRDVLRIAPGSKTLEVGAGTGKFIPLLRKCGGAITALEPVKGMRDRLSHDFPEVEVLEGTAEFIPLPDASVDAVVCAQSFHWFANAAALREMQRVLVPGGTLGLIWNGRDESVAWVAELSQITDRWEGTTPRYLSGEWRKVFPAEGFESIGERHVCNFHTGSPEQVVLDRTLSVSFIAALPQEQQELVARETRALISRTPELSGIKEIAFPYKTSLFAFQKVP